MCSLKNHYLEYKVHLALWGGGMHLLALSSVACPIPNAIPPQMCVRLCLSAFASACSRVCLCRRAPPDYGCYIINSDQICFVA